MKKLPMWQEHTSWEDAEQAWDEGAEKAKKENPLKILKRMPNIPGITDEAAKNLRWKSLRWMVKKDEDWQLAKHVIRHPIRHMMRYLQSVFAKERYVRDDDFFLYGIKSVKAFKKLLFHPDTLLVLGFSYCEKPHECPSGRFTPDCIHDPENNVCRQCFIGKSINALPTKNSIPLIIPNVHYIGNKMFEIKKAHPNKRVLFFITACEMTLEMFSDWGNMAGLQGVGVRLDGRICNTMRAFALSEEGIKPGLTVVLDDTKKRMLDLLKEWDTYQKEI